MARPTRAGLPVLKRCGISLGIYRQVPLATQELRCRTTSVREREFNYVEAPSMFSRESRQGHTINTLIDQRQGIAYDGRDLC